VPAPVPPGVHRRLARAEAPVPDVPARRLTASYRRWCLRSVAAGEDYLAVRNCTSAPHKRTRLRSSLS
jgi:hypothetical protein